MQGNKILVAYATNAGTTVKAGRSVGAELEKQGLQVDVLRLEEVTNVESYAGVVIGGPMIMGWHRGAMGFLKKHQAALARVPVALFLTARSLTRTGETSIDGIPICVDPLLAKAPRVEGKLSFQERYATSLNYVQPILKAAPRVKPVSVGLFGGELVMSRLNFLQMLFVLLVIRAEPGGSYNLPFIEKWAAGLFPQLAAKEPVGAASRLTA